MKNHNAAPNFSPPEQGQSAWDFGEPDYTGITPIDGGQNEWGSPSYQTWDSPPTNNTYNTYQNTGYSADWDSTWGEPQVSQSEQVTGIDNSEFGVGERLRKVKDRVIHGIGRKAVDAVMNRLPNFDNNTEVVQSVAANFYENPQQIKQTASAVAEVWGNRSEHFNTALTHAKSAGREVAGAGATAAKESVMKYYGLEKDEQEKLRVARKIKFGKAVVKTVINPIGTASSVGTRAAYSARKAVKNEARGQFAQAQESWRGAPVKANLVEQTTWDSWHAA